MKAKTLIFLLLTCLLTSCVAVIMAGTASSLVVYDRRAVSMVEKDARIFHVIHSNINHDSRFRASHIVVSSFNGVVLLAGQTPVSSLRILAEKIARQTPHVVRVYNEVTVDYPISMQEQSHDTWTTTQVRANMLAEKDLESGSIRIITEQGVVYLMGIVTLEQAEIAVNVARHIIGVRKVVKLFRYIH